MRHRRRATRHRPNYLLRLGALAFVFVAYSGSHVGAEPAPPEVAIWSSAPQDEPTSEPTPEPSYMERPTGTDEPIDCAEAEDPDLCVELGDEYEMP